MVKGTPDVLTEAALQSTITARPPQPDFGDSSVHRTPDYRSLSSQRYGNALRDMLDDSAK